MPQATDERGDERPRQPLPPGTEPEESKLPGVPGHLQAAVRQLIGGDAPASVGKPGKGG